MLKPCLKYLLALTLLVVLPFGLLSTPVYATRIITSATLNGSSSVTVESSASITAQVNVTAEAAGGPQWWSTSWNTGSGASCVNHDNHSAAGDFSESFTITAPGSDGTYDVSFIAYLDDNCSLGASNTYTLSGGITVTTVTPTPTSTVTPTPTSTPTPTATPTSAPGTSTPSSSSSTSTTIVYPSISMTRAGLQFIGTASIAEGVIDLVEYSLDDGYSWQKALAKDGKFDEISEDYVFLPEGVFSMGEHKIMARARSLAQVHTQSSGYASVTFTISPPKITLDDISPNPTKDQTPTITGVASSDYLGIASVQVSLDDGKSWFIAELIGNKFSLTTTLLEDGNYPVKARVFDAVGNIGESETEVMIIDTIPPIIGGNMVALGSQILTPDGLGIIRTVAGAENTIVMSMRGGVVKAVLEIENETFDLELIEGTKLWRGKIKFDQEGEKPAKIIAVDGANNRTERNISPFLIEKSGKVINAKDDTPIKGARVILYFFEKASETWVVWEGSAFGQKNPQETDEEGGYNYIVPPGRYYLEVKAQGFRTMQSEIFDLSETTTLVATFPLSLRPKIAFQLPIIGEIDFVVPFPFFAQTLLKDELWKHEEKSLSWEFGLKKGMSLPDFLLPDSQERIISPLNFKGKSWVLTFLSTWAPASIEQALILNATDQVLKENQATLAIFLQDSVGEVENFMKRGNYSFSTAIDKDGVTAVDYQISALPQHVFIDREGMVYDTFTGVLNKDELLEKLESLE